MLQKPEMKKKMKYQTMKAFLGSCGIVEGRINLADSKSKHTRAALGKALLEMTSCRNNLWIKDLLVDPELSRV